MRVCKYCVHATRVAHIINRAAGDWYGRLGVKAAKPVGRRPGTLSGGNQQKVSLAKWLAIGPARHLAGRADTRCRCRGQGRDLCTDPTDGGRRRCGARNLFGTAGTVADLRPDRGGGAGPCGGHGPPPPRPAKKACLNWHSGKTKPHDLARHEKWTVATSRPSCATRFPTRG